MKKKRRRAVVADESEGGSSCCSSDSDDVGLTHHDQICRELRDLQVLFVSFVFRLFLFVCAHI